MCKNYVKTCTLEGLEHFKFYNMNQSSTRLFYGPHCTDSLCENSTMTKDLCINYDMNSRFWYISNYII